MRLEFFPLIFYNLYDNTAEKMGFCFRSMLYTLYDRLILFMILLKLECLNIHVQCLQSHCKISGIFVIIKCYKINNFVFLKFIQYPSVSTEQYILFHGFNVVLSLNEDLMKGENITFFSSSSTLYKHSRVILMQILQMTVSLMYYSNMLRKGEDNGDQSCNSFMEYKIVLGKQGPQGIYTRGKIRYLGGISIPSTGHAHHEP